MQQRGNPVLLVLCGLPPLLENLARSKSYTERMFSVEELGHLTAPEDRRALTEPARGTGREFEAGVVRHVVAQTGGYPFFVQSWGDALWRGSTGAIIDATDLTRLEPRIAEALDRSFYESRLARVGTWEKRVMLAIAQHGEEARIGEVQRTSGIPNSGIQPAVSRLSRRGLLYRPSRGVVAFTAPMFGAFLRRRAL